MVPALGLSLTCLFIGGLSWPIGAIARRRFGVKLRYSGRAATAYRAARGFSLAAGIGFFAVMGVLLMMAMKWDRLDGSIDVPLVASQVIALLLFAAALTATLVDAVVSWRNGRGWVPRSWSVLAVASSAMLLWTGLVFHFANLSANY
jgi:hypothetical protein